MKTTVYFIRHGAVANPENVLYGRLPGFPLSTEGRLMAEKLAKLFSKKEISAVYTSPQLRCRQTAQTIARKLGHRILVSKLISEAGTSFDGLPKEKFERLEASLSDPKQLPNYQRESAKEIRRRMKIFLLRIVRRHTGKKVLVVTHGDPIVILKAFSEGKSFNWDYKKNNYVPIGGYYKILV